MTDGPRIVIVGGVAGGASAAARARRLSENARIILFERGRNISFANCGLPYHIGGDIPKRDSLLVQTARGMTRRFNIDVRTQTEVVAIDRAGRTVTARDLQSGTETTEPYDYLVLSPGAEPVRPPIPGADLPNVFTLRNLADMDAIKQAVDKPARDPAAEPLRAVVVGGGYIGLEMTEAFRSRGICVTLVELANQVFAPMDPEMVQPVHAQLRLQGVDLRLGASVKAIEPAEGRLDVRLNAGDNVLCDLVLLATGVRPEARLAREAGLAISPTGGIVVDEHMRTSDERIYAVGDAVEVTDLVAQQPSLIPLAGPANRQGRIAADNIFGRGSTYRKTQGTSICKVFDLAVGITGLSEKTASRLGIAFDKVYIHAANHASYYPGSSPISLKLLFDPRGGKVLGGQAVGVEGVDKRIDVLAVAIRAGMTVFDLEHLELSYAPPFGSAKDPINYAGFVAGNVLRGDVLQCQPKDMLCPSNDQALLDVRTSAEFAVGTIPGSVNIPLDELRSRLGELPRDKELLVFCHVGIRAYMACRILSLNGFRCRNLSGGYKTFKSAMEAAGAAPVQPVRGCSDEECSSKSFAADLPGQDSRAGDLLSAAGPSGADTNSARSPMNIIKEVDAVGLQCPGPIMLLQRELETVPAGQAVRVTASEPAFGADVKAWCHSTGNQLVDVLINDGRQVATVVRRIQSKSSPQPAGDSAMARHKTIVVFSGDFDKAMATFIIANGAAAMGSKVTLFFTFWGLNILRRGSKVPVRKNLVEKMFGWMMPRGADKLAMSKMNMGGMGLAMIKGIMRKKKVASLPELIDSARSAGVRLVACTMSMDLMGIKKEELVDGVEEGGVASFLDAAEAGNVNLFI